MPIIAFVALLILPGFYSWTSRLNQFFFFGRTVPPDFPTSPAARAITRLYKFHVWAGFVPAAAVGVLLARRHIVTFPIWMVLMELMVFYVAFARAHRAVARLVPASAPRPVVEVPLEPASRLPSLGALLAAPITGVAVLAAALVYFSRGGSLLTAPHALEALVAAHGGDSLLGFGMGLSFAGLLAPLIRFRARTRTPLGVNALRLSLIATWAGVLCFTAAIALAAAGITITRTESRAVILSGLFLAAFVLIFRTVVHRRYVPPPAEMQADEYWRWGLFYANRADPALFVQCRCGPGFTLNYGRALAWPLSAAFLAFLVAVLVTVKSH